MGTLIPRDSWIHYNYRLIINEAKKTEKAFNILDVGCGGGGTLRFFHAIFQEANLIIGVDILKTKITPAKIGRSPLEFTLADAHLLPFQDSVFDLIFLKDMLHHVDEPIKVLREIKRVCRTKIVIVEINRQHPVAMLVESINTSEQKHFTLNQLRTLVKRSGLFVNYFKQIYVYPFDFIIAKSKSPIVLFWNALISKLVSRRYPVLLLKAFSCLFSVLVRIPSYNVLYAVPLTKIDPSTALSPPSKSP